MQTSCGRSTRALGLSTGCVHDGLNEAERRAAYDCDITYGTASEVGFDFLRDRLKSGAAMEESARSRTARAAANHVQRGHYFALVDEADSILIDEASTPLIIGSEAPNQAAMTSLYQWAARIAPELSFRGDFIVEPKRRQAHLTDAGSRKVTLLAKPVVLDSIDTERIYLNVEKALTALYAFTRDKDYVVVDDEVGIVDEGTGRIMDGRKWQEGLHQAIEAKERAPITPATSSAARITIQSLFRRYQHLGGMTGTAVQSRRELQHVYRLKTSVISTHRPCLRRGEPTRVFLSLEAKRKAVSDTVQQLLATGRAVLIGTPSVEASEGLSAAPRGGEDRASDSECPAPCPGSGDRRQGRTVALRHHRHQHGGPWDGYPPERRRAGRRRAARHRDRDAYLGPHRPATCRPSRSAGRPRQLPVPAVTGGRTAPLGAAGSPREVAGRRAA